MVVQNKPRFVVRFNHFASLPQREQLRETRRIRLESAKQLSFEVVLRWSCPLKKSKTNPASERQPAFRVIPSYNKSSHPTSQSGSTVGRRGLVTGIIGLVSYWS